MALYVTTYLHSLLCLLGSYTNWACLGSHHQVEGGGWAQFTKANLPIYSMSSAWTILRPSVPCEWAIDAAPYLSKTKEKRFQLKYHQIFTKNLTANVFCSNKRLIAGHCCTFSKIDNKPSIILGRSYIVAHSIFSAIISSLLSSMLNMSYFSIPWIR